MVYKHKVTAKTLYILVNTSYLYPCKKKKKSSGLLYAKALRDQERHGDKMIDKDMHAAKPAWSTALPEEQLKAEGREGTTQKP